MPRRAKGKKYWFNVIEEAIMNENAKYFAGGRIAVFERDKQYAVYEARFWIPIEFMDAFREVFDFKESDHMPMIRWDYEELKKV